jgi:sec-independent protein translocase protein TatB
VFDFSWAEFLVVVIVAVIAIGPKQIPTVLHGLGRLVRRLQYMRFAMGKQFDDFMEQNDLNEIRDLKHMPRSVDLSTLTSIHDEVDDDEDFAKEQPTKTERISHE